MHLIVAGTTEFQEGFISFNAWRGLDSSIKSLEGLVINDSLLFVQ